MKVYLMFRDRDFLLEEGVPTNAQELIQDLALDTLFRAMGAGDNFLLEVAKSAVLASLTDRNAILYRQGILTDCLEFPEIVRELYALSVDAIERENKIWGWFSLSSPDSLLHRSIESLGLFLGSLERLRKLADELRSQFRSEGFMRFFDMIVQELDDAYLQAVKNHLERLEFPNGILMSVDLGPDCRGNNYILHSLDVKKLSWFEQVQEWVGQTAHKNGSELSFEVDPRDDAGFHALEALRTEGIANVAVALAQSSDHILSFFKALRLELGFYIGCLTLRGVLSAKQEPFCLPAPLAEDDEALRCQGVYDICLSLSTADQVVGNDVAGTNKSLVIITGANRGGKSTLLRGIGSAQLMMQCGMFVPARKFEANVCRGVFTHFKREEDASMKSGKLDEELSRMSSIVERITPRSLLLLNESFASTNEREGSEIARQIARALLEKKVKILYVTHMFDLANEFFRQHMDSVLFLRAERLDDGTRTFRLFEGPPEPTSYGEDLFRRIFQAESENLQPIVP
jgi:MutS domain V